MRPWFGIGPVVPPHRGQTADAGRSVDADEQPGSVRPRGEIRPRANAPHPPIDPPHATDTVVRNVSRRPADLSAAGPAGGRSPKLGSPAVGGVQSQAVLVEGFVVRIMADGLIDNRDRGGRVAVGEKFGQCDVRRSHSLVVQRTLNPYERGFESDPEYQSSATCETPHGTSRNQGR